MITIGDAELEVLRLLWAHGPATVRELRDRLNKQGRTLAYTTVQTMLNRLRDKDVVTAEKVGNVNRFEAVLSLEDVVSEEVAHLIDRYCEDDVAPLMLALVAQGQFSPKEIEMFRAMLDRLEDAT